MSKTKRLNLRISDDLDHWLREYNKKSGIPMTKIVEDALQQKMDKIKFKPGSQVEPKGVWPFRRNKW